MRSLQSRLLIGMLVGMVVVLGVTGTAIYAAQRHHMLRGLDDMLLGGLGVLTTLVRVEPHGIEFRLDELSNLPPSELRGELFFQIWSDDLTQEPWPPEAFRPPPPPPGPPPPSERLGWRPRFSEEDDPQRFTIRSPALGTADLPRIDTPLREPAFRAIVLPDGRGARAVGLTFRAAQHGPPPPERRRPPEVEFTVTLAAGTERIDHALAALGVLLGGTGLLGAALSVGVAWIVTRRGLRPLRHVAREIGAIDAARLAQRVSCDDVPREVKAMVGQLNDLLERVEEAFERERTLTANIAHELRTPLAGLRSVAEIALSRERDLAGYRQALDETLEITAQMQALVEKLLTLARLEAGALTPSAEPIALHPAILEQWERMQVDAEKNGIALDLTVPENLSVWADRHLLGVVLANALANAVSYVPSAGSIRAWATSTGHAVELEIANPCTGLTTDQVQQVFERFWRADEARTVTGLSCGLGLALVRRAMDAMSGTASAHLNALSHFVLRLEFPLPPG